MHQPAEEAQVAVLALAYLQAALRLSRAVAAVLAAPLAELPARRVAEVLTALLALVPRLAGGLRQALGPAV
jgi:hypothetical protein